jgi:hypothetical protein
MTDPIFGQLAIVNKQAKDDPTILRLSLDAKATVNVGNFSRGGKTRVDVEGNDHDFKPKAKITPYGIFLLIIVNIIQLKELGGFWKIIGMGVSWMKLIPY